MSTGSTRAERPTSIAVTSGEPAGIGPDLLVTFAQSQRTVPLVAFADPGLLQARAKQLGLGIRIHEFGDKRPSQAAGTLTVRPIPLSARVEAGKASPETANAVIESIRCATQAVLDGDMAALVTCPVHKSVIAQSGTPFSGHTEMLAELSQTPHVVMLLVSDSLKLALATRHLALSEVPSALSRAGLTRTLEVLEQGLWQAFSIQNPRLLVAGLNPHAGEDGELGNEEISIIRPVINKLRAKGKSVQGPFPADTLFTPRMRARSDAILAMYHDQGLAPFKALAFGDSVNLTLGLPFVRTSVDHGTALDLAGTGNIDLGSFKAAYHLACRLAANTGSTGNTGNTPIPDNAVT